MNNNILQSNIHSDFRGNLVEIPFNELSFIPKRIFYIYDVPINTIRGNHAHYASKQYTIVLKGTIELILNNGIIETKYILREGEKLLINRLVWNTIKFLEPDTVLMVVCSNYYEADDYITDFSEFKKITNNYKMSLKES